MHVHVQELPDKIGVSRRTLFAGRADDSSVTAKTWLKLEAAERQADISEGLLAVRKMQAETSTSQEDFEKKVKVTGALLEAAGQVPEDCPAGIARLEGLMVELLGRMERLEGVVAKLGGKKRL